MPLAKPEASSESELLFIKTKGQFWRGWCSSQCIAELFNHLFYSIHATPSFVPSSVLPVVEHSLAGGAGLRALFQILFGNSGGPYGKRPNIRLGIPRATHWNLVLRPGPTVCCM